MNLLDHISAKILSQYGKDKLFYSMALFSCKQLSQEINYEIYDKELLGIIKSFKELRLVLKGAGLPVQSLTTIGICSISCLQNSYLTNKDIRENFFRTLILSFNMNLVS